MKNSILGYGLTAAAVVGTLSFAFVSAPAAQQKSNAPTSVTVKSPAAQPRTADKDPLSMPTPRMPNGHPSLTGFWAGGAPPDADDGTNPTDPNQTVHEITKTSNGS